MEDFNLDLFPSFSDFVTYSRQQALFSIKGSSPEEVTVDTPGDVQEGNAEGRMMENAIRLYKKHHDWKRSLLLPSFHPPLHSCRHPHHPHDNSRRMQRLVRFLELIPNGVLGEDEEGDVVFCVRIGAMREKEFVAEGFTHQEIDFFLVYYMDWYYTIYRPTI